MNDNSYFLQLGSTGNDVRILQQKLKILNLYAPSITGSFDTTTENAVKAFQEENNLNVTGIVDVTTWTLLLDETQKDYQQTFNLTPPLTIGTSGPEVKNLQEDLKTLLYYDNDITGEFDPSTELAVQTFQLNNDITSTGVVDEETELAIASLYSPLSNCQITENPSIETENYIIKKGDTLYSIAKKFNTTVDELKRINNLTSNTLTIGNTLKIPKQESSTPPTENTTYTVKKGDTLYSISKAFNVNINDLINYNNLTNTTLSIGQTLIIPSTNNYINYTVKKGDTLYSIARNYNINVNDLMKLNNLSSSVLTIGQTLVIPVETSNNYTTYYVQRGDTLYSIAKSYNTTVDNIKNINNLQSNTLSIGQKLFLP